ncbi:MFS transporter [Streptosporangiaceae bacterium NEAU-GS5]|nr:MFS transporter [Streptosporangiaceae bacterium NEAU-GS5]
MPQRWVMLAIGTGAQCAGTIFLYGLPFLIPALRETTGMSLAALGLVVASPSLGMVLALIGWGALADRRGERLTILAGLTLSCFLLVGAAFAAHSGVALGILLVLAGACGASVYAASGRVVIGWFEPGQRGLAMGIRQTSQPVGVALAGAVLPAVAQAAGLRAAFLTIAGICLVALSAAVFLNDAPRPASSAAPVMGQSPYRMPTLWRIHAGSALMVCGQLAVGSFALEYVVTELHFRPTTAAPLLSAAQLLGGAARIAAGRWSDHTPSRFRAFRFIAAVNALIIGSLALAAGLPLATGSRGAPIVIGALAVAIVATVSWHGVGYAVVAEAAPASWAGRALSVQTVAQNIAGAVTPPAFGLLITTTGFPVAYGLAALFPLIAATLIPATGFVG